MTATRLNRTGKVSENVLTAKRQDRNQRVRHISTYMSSSGTTVNLHRTLIHKQTTNKQTNKQNKKKGRNEEGHRYFIVRRNTLLMEFVKKKKKKKKSYAIIEAQSLTPGRSTTNVSLGERPPPPAPR